MARRLGLQIRMLAGGAEVLYAEEVWLRGLYLNQRPPAPADEIGRKGNVSSAFGGRNAGEKGRAL
jgi:hypothetical protein